MYTNKNILICKPINVSQMPNIQLDTSYMGLNRIPYCIIHHKCHYIINSRRIANHFKMTNKMRGTIT